MSSEQISGLILGIIIPFGFLLFFHGFVILVFIRDSRRSLKYKIKSLESDLKYTRKDSERYRELILETLRDIRKEGRK